MSNVNIVFIIESIYEHRNDKSRINTTSARRGGAPEKSRKLTVQKFKDIFFTFFFGKPKQDLFDVPSETDGGLDPKEIEINSWQDSVDVPSDTDWGFDPKERQEVVDLKDDQIISLQDSADVHSERDEELVPKGSEDRLHFKDAEETRVPQETEMNSLLATLFRKDIQHMINAYLEKEDNQNKGLLFRALMQINPDHPLGMPILVTRPIERPNKAEEDYYNGNDSSMYHRDIWLDWELLTETDSNNERTLIVKTINEKLGGYDQLSHAYLRVKRDKKGKPIIAFESGWRYFQIDVAERLRPGQPNPQLTTEETMELIKQLARYGIDTVSSGDEVISVEEVVLTEMMRPLILENAEKLRAVITDSAVLQYISLAYKFLTKPDANKSSPLYYRFLEFEEIIKKIDENSKNK